MFTDMTYEPPLESLLLARSLTHSSITTIKCDHARFVTQNTRYVRPSILQSMLEVSL